MLTVSRTAFRKKICPDDAGPDYLGHYSNTPTPAAIDRRERGDWSSHEYFYFVPALTAEQTGNPDSPEQDYQRMEAYNRGEWSMIGVKATVRVSIPVGEALIVQEFTSPGVWGIESDFGDHINEVFADECSVLTDVLQALGITVID